MTSACGGGVAPLAVEFPTGGGHVFRVGVRGDLQLVDASGRMLAHVDGADMPELIAAATAAQVRREELPADIDGRTDRFVRVVGGPRCRAIEGSL